MTYRRPLRWVELLDDLTSVEFLLSVRFAGRDFYFSTVPRVLLDDAGEPIQFDGGLDVSWTDALDFLNESPTLLAVPLALFFPVDVAALVADGHDLWRGTGELSLWVEGRPYGARVVLVAGSMVSPSYGGVGEPVKFSLEANGFQDTHLTHTQNDRVKPTTWPNADPAAALAYYPLVFGTPGFSGTGLSVPGSPALAVDLDTLAGTVRFLVAGHPVEAQTVTLTNVTKDPPVSLLVSVSEDVDQKNKVVTVSPVVPVGGFFDPGDEVWVTWDNGGGMLNDRQTAARTGAGEVMDFFLRLSSLSIDTGAWRTLSPELNQDYHLSGYVNDAVKPWAWVSDNILPLLPVSVYATGGGLSVALWRRAAKKDDAVGTIEAVGGVGRVGPVQYEDQSIANNIRLDYGLDAAQREYQRTAGVLGDPNPITDDTGIFSTEYSRASFLRYGTQTAVLSTDIVTDTATAGAVLQWMHRARSMPYRVLHYTVPIRMGFLVRGDVILLTDAELFLSDYLCFVRDISWTNGQPKISLVLVDDPPREDRLD